MYQMNSANVILVHNHTLTYRKGSVIRGKLICSGSLVIPDYGEESNIYERNYVYFRNSTLFMNKAEIASFTEHV